MNIAPINTSVELIKRTYVTPRGSIRKYFRVLSTSLIEDDQWFLKTYRLISEEYYLSGLVLHLCFVGCKIVILPNNVLKGYFFAVEGAKSDISNVRQCNWTKQKLVSKRVSVSFFLAIQIPTVVSTFPLKYSLFNLLCPWNVQTVGHGRHDLIQFLDFSSL